MKHVTLFLFLFILNGYSFAQHTAVLDIPLSNWKFSEAGKDEWKPASVPGNIHLDLLTNKLISDPAYGENIKKCQWVETKDWEYTTLLPLDTIHRDQLAGANAEL
ncbi:MAG TPA: glycoside hydrolase family 2 protein, partial [Bacteroidia bacterium]|nr:glycoside hydrolase family 2 protein [Bacteroidia bacterium]